MPKKILLADDSVTIQKVVELTFSEGDYEVTSVSNGKLALEHLGKNRPDILICDIIMPEMSGYDVAEFVKRNPLYSAIPVILLTGTFEPFDEERARKSGAEAYVTKPFDSKMLVDKVESLLAAKVQVPQVQTVAPATIITSGQEYQLPGVVTDEAIEAMKAAERVQAPPPEPELPSMADLQPQAFAPMPPLEEMPPMAQMTEPSVPEVKPPEAEATVISAESPVSASFDGFDALMEPPVPSFEESAPALPAVETPAVPAIEEPFAPAPEPAAREFAAPPSIDSFAAPAMETPSPAEEEHVELPQEVPGIDAPAAMEEERFEPPSEEPSPVMQLQEPAFAETAAPQQEEAEVEIPEVTSEDISKNGDYQPEEDAGMEVAPPPNAFFAPQASQEQPEPHADEVEVGPVDRDFFGAVESGVPAEPEPPFIPPGPDGPEIVTDLNAQAMMVAEGQRKLDEEKAARAAEMEQAGEFAIPGEQPFAEEPVHQALEQEFAGAVEPAAAEFPGQEQAQPAVPSAESAAPQAQVQVSTEMVEAMVRKAVQELAPGILRDIAWEVIPELANSIIKKRIEELEKAAE